MKGFVIINAMKAYLLKILRFIASHHYIKALQKSMVSVIGVSFIAGILLIIQNPPLTPLTDIKFISSDWVHFASENAGLLSLAIQLTLGMIGVYTLIAFILTLCHHYKLNPFHPILSGLIAYLFLSVGYQMGPNGLEVNLGYCGYSGIFTAFILGIFVVEGHRLSLFVFEKIKARLKPKEGIAYPIEATLISFLMIMLALVGRYYLVKNKLLLPDLVFTALMPWLKGSNSLWFVLGVIVLSKLLWFIGINGNSLISLSLLPMMVMFNAENLIAFQNDKALPYLFTTGFLFFELGVLPLASAILLFSKNKAHRNHAKLGFLPAVFNIQETMIAGLPMTFNGLYLIPFILSSVVSLGITTLAITVFWVNKPLFAFAPSLPGFLGAYLSTLDWRALVLWFGCYLLATLIYWPFIRISNKQSLPQPDEAA